MKPPTVITIFTNARPGETEDAVKRVIERTTDAGIQVRVPTEELEKHHLDRDAVLGCEPDDETDLVVVLGGDGTILTALRAFAGRGVPVLSFNFGEIGFLSTFEKDALDEGIERAISGDFEVVPMSGLVVATPEGRKLGVNDISFHRRPDSRVAELGYSVTGDRLGEVRCDGLVASTPVGSTGYNLANGGPVLAWGVEGFVVSFIAPHTLTARSLVVAPDDVLTVQNLSGQDAVDVTTDGRIVHSMAPGEELDVCFEHDQFLLAQRPGATFYHRFREKFGRLAY